MHAPHSHTFLDEITGLAHQNPMHCYQCGKCSAGCPVRQFSSDPPNRVVRYVQLGLYDRAMKSDAIWKCAGCLTCSTRCPKKFDLARFMDAVRELAQRRGIAPSDEAVATFHDIFLSMIKKNGRLYELGLLRDFKLRTRRFMKDVSLAPKMLLTGKMNLMPHRVRNPKAVARIFSNATKGEQR